MADNRPPEKQSTPEAASLPIETAFTRPNARPECFRSTPQEILFIVTAGMAVAMTGFLQGCTIVISSFAGRDLNMTTSEITWMTASSALTSGSFLLFFGKVADMFGRRMMFVGSFFLFSFFAVGTGFSKSGIMLDVLNGVMGLMSASAVPPAQGILGSVYDRPSKRKNYAFACFSAGNPLGFVTRAIASRIATQLFGWRASFWLLAIIYLIVGVIALFTVPANKSVSHRLTIESLKQFGIVGALLTISGIGLFSTGISIAPDAAHGWKTPYVLVLITLGIFSIATFIWWERRVEYPLMPMYIWRDREFSLLTVIVTLGFMAFPPMFFFVALYMQELYHQSALITAVRLLPMVVSGLLVNAVAGLILHKISNKLLLGVAAAAYTVAFLLLAVQKCGYTYWGFSFPALALVVVGAEMEFNVANMYVLSSLPKSEQSIAGSIFQTVIKLAVTIGIGACTAIFRSVMEKPATSGYYAHDPFEPYAATFWFSMACAFASLLLVPLMKIKTQGNH